MARGRRTAMLAALALAAGAHGLLVAWLAAQVSVLRFRAGPVADRSGVLIELRPLPSAAARPRPVPRPAPTAAPAPEPQPSGPVTIDEGGGAGGLSNLARPVFLAWPHPTPAGVDWGPGTAAAEPPPKLALSGPWADCLHAHDKDEDPWASPAGGPSRPKPPCIAR